MISSSDPALQGTFDRLSVVDLPEAYDLYAHITHKKIPFSTQTFGPGRRSKGIVEHILQELVEIESDPLDVEEWIDVLHLALDACWRHLNANVVDLDMALAIVTGLRGDVQLELTDHAPPNPNFDLIAFLKDFYGLFSDLDAEFGSLETTVSNIRSLLSEARPDEICLQQWLKVCLLAFEGAFGCLKDRVATDSIPNVVAAVFEQKHVRNANRSWPDFRTLSEDVAINHSSESLC